MKQHTGKRGHRAGWDHDRDGDSSLRPKRLQTRASRLVNNLFSCDYCFL